MSKEPILSEDSFQKLLAAAYVLQQQLDQVAGQQDSEGQRRLDEIAETQHLIQVRRLDLQNAMDLVADRALRLTGVSCCRVFLAESGELKLAASRGEPTSPDAAAGSANDLQLISCFESGTIFSADGSSSKNGSNATSNGARVIVPIHQNGEVAGLFETQFAKQRCGNQDVRTCELMAGLVAEALMLQSGKEDLASERVALLNALEKIKPQLEKLVEETPARPADDSSVTKSAEKPAPAKSSGLSNLGAFLVARQAQGLDSAPWKTPVASATALPLGETPVEDRTLPGRPLATGSMKRPAPQITAMRTELTTQLTDEAAGHEKFSWDDEDSEPAAQHSNRADAAPGTWDPPFRANLMSSVTESVTTEGSEAENTTEPVPDDIAESGDEQFVSSRPSALALQRDGDLPEAKPTIQSVSPWTSAASAKQWLEQARKSAPAGGIAELLKRRWSEAFLGAAVVLLAISLGWAVWPRHKTPRNPATTAHSAPAAQPEPDLTPMERLMVALGLAEVPTVPVKLEGNPNIQVWIDTHTALYYCPGSELYGKTEQGHYLTQQEAQRAQFEPAHRQPCQ